MNRWRIFFFKFYDRFNCGSFHCMKSFEIFINLFVRKCVTLAFICFDCFSLCWLLLHNRAGALNTQKKINHVFLFFRISYYIFPHQCKHTSSRIWREKTKSFEHLRSTLSFQQNCISHGFFFIKCVTAPMWMGPERVNKPTIANFTWKKKTTSK